MEALFFVDMENLISSVVLFGLSFFSSTPVSVSGEVLSVKSVKVERQVLAKKTMNLATRHKDPWVNEVFSDNILLNLHYLKDDIKVVKNEKGKIDWEKVRQPFEFSFQLEPGQTFAYHKNLLPDFKDKNVLVGKSRFWYDEDYKSDGYLVGDGICHLATLFNWVAQSAGLEVVAYVNHDFLPVPEIPREFGTSILYSPDGGRNSARQNLYITNNFSHPMEFRISANTDRVEIRVAEGKRLY